MAGTDTVEPAGSTALLGVQFDDGFGKKYPPLESDRLPNFRPCSIVQGVWEVGYGCNGRAWRCAFEPPTFHSNPRPIVIFFSNGDGSCHHMSSIEKVA